MERDVGYSWLGLGFWDDRGLRGDCGDAVMANLGGFRVCGVR